MTAENNIKGEGAEVRVSGLHYLKVDRLAGRLCLLLGLGNHRWGEIDPRDPMPHLRHEQSQ